MKEVETTDTLGCLDFEIRCLTCGDTNCTVEEEKSAWFEISGYYLMCGNKDCPSNNTDTV